uniref:Small ribosomal subunit protein mS29 n=1 Tax=Daucus carota subsp. sativus TaxID=79200 RepID=A0A175YME7_DAUCS
MVGSLLVQRLNARRSLASLLFSRTFASKKPKSSPVTKNATKSKKGDPKSKNKHEEFGLAADDTSSSATDNLVIDDSSRLQQLALDDKDKSLDVGLDGRPLFTSATSISQLNHKHASSYINFSMKELDAVLPEGLPDGMLKEFEDSKRNALLVRQSFLDLRDNYRRIVDPPLQSAAAVKGPKAQKQIVLDGPVSCGKSIALAMLVHWARSEGWLVFYVPKGREWTHGGFFYRNQQTGLWDTPVQAASILQAKANSYCYSDFMKYNESRLLQLPCQVFDPIPLGEGVGVGQMKDVDTMAMPEGSTLYDLVQAGLNYTHASVGVLVQLRKELSLVKDIPVLIAIDQYNNWFTFSEYEEPVTVRSTRPIHAKELATVNAFRSMINDDMMIGAFSHSTAVGKLRQELPDVPTGARINFPRYTLEEAGTVCHYYLRCASAQSSPLF